MPDGDQVHPGLTRPYQKVYKQICEGQFNDESLAEEVIDALRCQLGKVGDKPAQVIARIAAHLDAISKQPLLTNWREVSSEIEQIVAQGGISKRVSAQIIDASKGLLYAIRTGNEVSNFKIQLMEHTLNRIYTAEFEERVPMVHHHNGVSDRFIKSRLEAMRPHIEEKLSYLAQQAAKRVTFRNLRRPPVMKPKIDLYETDITALS